MTVYTKTEFEQFFAAYLECAAWASTDVTPDGEDIDNLEGYDYAPETETTMRAECADFLTDDTCALIESAQDQYGYGWEGSAIEGSCGYAMAGHDFWLTRNGHGAGFWDRGIGDIGDKLTELAKWHGSSDLYIGDDGELYVA